MKQILTSLAGTLILGGLLWSPGAAAQDFNRSYAMGGGGHVRIGNVSGDVIVTGYNGDTIIVRGFSEGLDRDRIQVEDLSTGDRVDVRVKYPENCNCDASIRFEVNVPRSVSYNFDRLASVSGEVEVTGVSGQLKAESVSGNVLIKDVEGQVSASTVSGNVNAEITRIDGAGSMKFSAVSGNVNVRAPANLDADIEMSTVSGSLKTDFPIEVQERRYGPGRSARGRLGNGANNLRITTVSGRVSLTRLP